MFGPPKKLRKLGLERFLDTTNQKTAERQGAFLTLAESNPFARAFLRFSFLLLVVDDCFIACDCLLLSLSFLFGARTHALTLDGGEGEEVVSRSPCLDTFSFFSLFAHTFHTRPSCLFVLLAYISLFFCLVSLALFFCRAFSKAGTGMWVVELAGLARLREKGDYYQCLCTNMRTHTLELNVTHQDDNALKRRRQLSS